MITRNFLLLSAISTTMVVAGSMASAAPPVESMPAPLQGLPPKARKMASELQRIVTEQQGMIQRALEAKTPEQREHIFRDINRNVQAIAQKRVAIMEQYTERIRARVQWARDHAAKVQVSDLTRTMEEFARPGPPQSPFAKQPDDVRPRDGSHRMAGLPRTVQSVRNRLARTMSRLHTLERESERAHSDEQRDKIRREIAACLKTIEKERVTVLEVVLTLSEERLRRARQQAQVTGSSN